jgi:hypothetical protein
MAKPFVPRNRRRLERPGVLSSRSVRLVSFFSIGIGLFLTAAICVLAIWEYTSSDAAWRSVATLGVITGTLLLFTALNEWFGLRIRESERVDPPGPSTPHDSSEQNESTPKAEL